MDNDGISGLFSLAVEWGQKWGYPAVFYTQRGRAPWSHQSNAGKPQPIKCLDCQGHFLSLGPMFNEKILLEKNA